ncbi:TetR/AcrR family transcriptional regulator [Shewanella eurypsychrophilus]|uniref:TetR/AcrR family transcriptional regulator n=1 Tax=Shewanella eurypsychrophilus TaxID=2593656 RepID=A0ABX6V9Q9_9GAMM|nr:MULTISPECIES: TetR/AcrR family transcriptional regulator [Shewanella]QFU21929.1 TetR family transcriptional regulator [Shewanella sp. YLB-09]QPG57218.1 TetR/AcrR family transcriptional regulator [Shewanella eurypsychrophilus]
MNNYLLNPPKVISDILKASAEVIKEQGMCSFKMATIASRAGCSKKTLYNYFSCKEDIVVSLYIQHINDVSKNVNKIINSDSLSNQEKIIYSMAYDPMKCWAADKDDLCINFLGVNPHIYNLASPEFVGNLQVLFIEVKEQAQSVWKRAISEGELLSSKEDILNCILLLNEVERGAVAMGQNRFLRQFGYDCDLRPTFDALCWILQGLKWQKACPSLSYENMIKTISPMVSKKNQIDMRHYALTMESLKENIEL